MWLARLIITLILQFFGVRRYGDKIAGRFCLSFFVTEKRLNLEPLQIKPEDPYLAYWTKNLKPIYGEEMYSNFKEENKKWLSEKYSLHFPQEESAHRYLEEKSFLKTCFESCLSGFIGNMIESLLKKTFKKRTLKKSQSNWDRKQK